MSTPPWTLKCSQLCSSFANYSFWNPRQTPKANSSNGRPFRVVVLKWHFWVKERCFNHDTWTTRYSGWVCSSFGTPWKILYMSTLVFSASLPYLKISKNQGHSPPGQSHLVCTGHNWHPTAILIYYPDEVWLLGSQASPFCGVLWYEKDYFQRLLLDYSFICFYRKGG